MKQILITGKNSYIGTSVEQWLLRTPNNDTVTTLDLKESSWKDHDFSMYDVVFHVAGIAHVKETKQNKLLYFSVNRDLAFDVAKQAKNAGVKQFIFLSSMSVYGLDTGVITKETIPCPKSSYGQSKLEAEDLIKALHDLSFKVVLIRPPMVYGKGCKGNYQLLSKFAKITPIFPKVDNQRSMIFIDNLSEFVKLLIDNEAEGLFLPQNKEYVNTSEMVQAISLVHRKPLHLSKTIGFILSYLKLNLQTKIFGSLTYSHYDDIYNEQMMFVEFDESITRTEI